MIDTEVLYARQQPLPIVVPQSAIVVGVGGSGSWTALFLAMSGVRNLALLTTTEWNLVTLIRLPFKRVRRRQTQTEVVQEFIQAIRPDCNIEVEGRADRFTLELVKDHQFLFDCTDRIDTQQFLCSWCKDSGISYIRTGYDGLHVTSGIDPSGWSTTDEIITGYTITPSWAVPAAMVALMSLIKVMANQNFSFSGDIRNIIANPTPPFMFRMGQSNDDPNNDFDEDRLAYRQERQEDCRGYDVTWEDCDQCDYAEDCPYFISEYDD